MAKTRETDQRSPLRQPQKWEDVRYLVIQLDNQLNTVYRRIGQLERRLKELEDEQED